MIYECDKCEAALPPGVTVCPRCGEKFDDPVPTDAEVPKPGFSPKPFPAPSQATHLASQPAPLATPTAQPAPLATPTAQPALPATANNAGFSIRRVLGLLIVCLIAIPAFFVMSGSNHGSTPSTPSQAAEPVAPATTSPTDSATPPSGSSASDGVTQLGDEGHLTTGDGNDVTLAATQEAIDKFAAAATAKDTVGVRNMMEAGDLFDVDSGTKAKLIGYGDGFFGPTKFHIRLESGPYLDRDAWVPMEYLKK